MKRRAEDRPGEPEDPTVLLECGHRVPRTAVAAAHAECSRCDRFEWPEGFHAYKRTPEFTTETVPAGLRRDHSTKPGVWARVVVAEGELEYHVEALNAHFLLTPACPGVVVPEVLHHVTPRGAVRFHVEFHRRRTSTEEPAA